MEIIPQHLGQKAQNGCPTSGFRFELCALLLLLSGLCATLHAQVSVNSLMGRSQNLVLQEARTNEIVGRYVVINPSSVAIKIFVSFSNSCNIQHFTRSDKQVPIQKVSLRIDGSTTVELYDRSTAGGDCNTALTWTPSAPYQDSYTLDVLLDWNDGSSQCTLAGSYSEYITLIAVEI